MSVALNEKAQENKYPVVMVVNNGGVSEPPPPPPPRPKKGSANASTAGGAKKKSRKRRGEEARAVVIRASESAREDAVLRARRGKGQQGMRMVHEEWYSYQLLDLDLAEAKKKVYVCGKCNYARPWLRKIEEAVTVANFRSIMRHNIHTMDEAAALLGLGVYGEKISGRDEEDEGVDAGPENPKPRWPEGGAAKKKRPAASTGISTTEQKRSINKSKNISQEKLEKAALKVSAKIDKDASIGRKSKTAAKKRTSRARIADVMKRMGAFGK